MPLPRGNRVKHPKAQGYGALISDLYVRLAASPQFPLRIYTRDSLAQRQDQAGSVLENVLDIGYVFARTDFSGGERLDWDPRLISELQGSGAIDDIRFWSSRNMDVRRSKAGEQYTLKLSRAWANFATGFTALSAIVTTSTHIYVADGQTVTWYDGWDNSTPINSHTNGASNVVMMASSPNDDVFYVAANGDGYYKAAGASVFTLVYSSTPGVNPDLTHIWWAKGRWIVYTAVKELREINAAGTLSAAFDTVVGTVHSVVSSGPGIVAACSDGTLRTYVAEGSPITLTPKGRTPVPEGGEVPILLGSNANVLIIITRADEPASGDITLRLYTGEVLDSRFDYSVGAMQLRREWFDTSHTINKAARIVPSREEMWWLITDSAGETHSWRLDVVTGGISRHAFITSSSVNGLALFQDKLGCFQPTIVMYSGTLFHTSGYLIFPNITFGLNTPINWIATVLEAQNIDGTGGKVELYRSSDPEAILDPNSPAWVYVRAITNESQSGREEALVNVTSRTQSLMLVVYAGTLRTQSPEITRTAIRGIPKHRDWIVELPVNVSDMIEVAGRVPVRIPGFGDQIHNALLDMQGRHVELTLYDPPFSFRGVYDNTLSPVEYISERGASSRLVVAQFRGTRLTGTSQTSGNFGIGVSTLGVGTLGVETET